MPVVFSSTECDHRFFSVIYLSNPHASLDGVAFLVPLQAIVRSASLGGNIYSTSDSPPPTTKSIPTSPDAATRTAASIERENLVRTLATVLRFPLVVKRVHSERTSGAGVPAPSSSVHGGTGEFLWHAAKAAEQYGLTRALIEFLPPAREDGVEGVTKTSVALMPEWSAPPALTANVCGCLLHLLGASGAGTNVVNQVRSTVRR